MDIPFLPEPSPDLLNLVSGSINTIIDRPGEWMPTFAGRRFYPVDPRPEEVSLEDVSTGLSRQPRFTGQTRWMSRVATHGTLTSFLVPLLEGLPALFHDSGEAYIGDQIRPVKEWLRRAGIDVFDRMEAGILRAVFQHFKIPTAAERGVPGAVKWDSALPPAEQSRALVGKIVKCADNAAVIIESVRLYGYQEVTTWEIGPQVPWGEAWFKHYQGAAEEQNHMLLQTGRGIPRNIFHRIMRSEDISERESKLAFEQRYRDLLYLMENRSRLVEPAK
jgi:hypothetical protein